MNLLWDQEQFPECLLSLGFPIYKLGPMTVLIWDSDMSDYASWTWTWYCCSKESIEKKKKNSPQYSFTIKEGVRWTRFSHWLGASWKWISYTLGFSFWFNVLKTPPEPIKLWLLGREGKLCEKSTSVLSNHYETMRHKQCSHSTNQE